MTVWKTRFQPLILLSLLLLAIPANAVYAQEPNSIYFEETGHWIRGKFLQRFLSADDPLLIFGFPITDEIVDPLNNVTTQYFQRARMDIVDGVVKLVDLGKFLYTPGAPMVATNSTACRIFAVTQKSVCYAFLQFYDAHQGQEFFGNPLSELEIQDGRYVQYFERARMEWRPELTSGGRVALTDLGKIYYDAFGIHREIGSTNTINISQVKPQVHAFVAKSLLSNQEQQTIYVVAQDQFHIPIEGAQVILTIHWPDGSQESLKPPVTNADGISQYTLSVDQLLPLDVVEVDAGIMVQEVEVNTSTWFRVWW
jgi:hypothetical protein